MKALLRNNAPIALLLFASWFGINLYGVSVPVWGALLALGLFFLAFFGASYLALHNGARSFLWAIGWTIITLAVSAVVIVILAVSGLFFTHI
jgi:hypothetical protein